MHLKFIYSLMWYLNLIDKFCLDQLGFSLENFSNALFYLYSAALHHGFSFALQQEYMIIWLLIPYFDAPWFSLTAICFRLFRLQCSVADGSMVYWAWNQIRWLYGILM